MTEQNRQYDPPPFMFSHWEYLEPIRRHRSFVVVFVTSAMLCALALTYIYSEKYEATVSLVFAAGEVTRLQFRGNSSEAFGAPMPIADFKVVGNTLRDLAGSERLLRQIVAQFELDAPEERVYEGPWYIRYYEMAKDYGKEYALDAWAFLKYGRLPAKDPTAEAVRQLAKDTLIFNEDSYVFYLTVRDTHPARAAAIADAMAVKLVAIANEADTKPAGDRRRELAALLAGKERDIERYQRQIDGLLRKNNLTSVSLELQEGVTELYALEAEQRRLNAQIEEIKRKVQAFDDKLASVEQLTQRSRKRAPGQVNAERLQSDDIRKILSEKLFSEVDLDGLKARSSAFEASINRLNTRLKILPVLKLSIDQLEKDLVRTNREYGLINVALNELVVAESEDVAEFRVQHAATVPTAPVTPVKVYHVGLAGFLGISVAVGLIYVFTYFNIRIFAPTRGRKRRRQAEEQETPPPSLEKAGAAAVSDGRDRETVLEVGETEPHSADPVVRARRVER